MAGMAILALAGCGGDAGAASEPRAGGRLFLAGIQELWVVDPDTETVERIPRPELGAGDPPHLIATVGDQLAMWSYHVSTVPLADPGAEASTLARDGWIFIPAADPNRVWVGYRDPATGPARGLGELREIDADGNVVTRGVVPPDGAWPYAEVAGGLLFDGPPPLRLWDPDTGSTLRTYEHEEIGDKGDVSGDILASCLSNCEELLFTDFASGEQRAIPAPRDSKFAVWAGKFSPDGETYAVPVMSREGGWRAFSQNVQRLALVSVDDGTVGTIEGSTVRPGYVFTLWSPAGDRVFLTGGGPTSDRAIVSYTLGDETAEQIDVEVGDFYDAAAG